jgi:hypothetical protein
MRKKIRLRLDEVYAVDPEKKEPRIWRCYVCGREAAWSDGWAVYNSIRDQEEGSPLLISCSEKCRRERIDPEQDLADLWAECGWSPPAPQWPYTHRTKMNRVGKKKPPESFGYQ